MEKFDPAKFIKETVERFNSYTDEEIVAAFNRQLGNSGWGIARSIFLGELQKQFEKRGIDYSIVKSEGGGLCLAKGNDVILRGNRLLKSENNECVKQGIEIIPYLPPKIRIDNKIKKGKTKYFTLIFTGLPKDCKSFDLIESIPEAGGFCLKNIKRNKTDVYQIDFF